MRASTLFAVTIAILLGLAAAITVKVTGYFTTPTAPQAAKQPDINVLVANRNIFISQTKKFFWRSQSRPESEIDQAAGQSVYFGDVSATSSVPD